MKLLSAEPEVTLTRSFTEPYKSIITAARTCYSPQGIISDEQVKHNYESLVSDIYKAGHHTTFQHAQFQFAITNVSRHAVWSFLHSHPFYNSEQVSQRYVSVEDGNYFVPSLHERPLKLYQETIEMQSKAYAELKSVLFEPTSEEYFIRFPGRAKVKDKYEKDIEKKAQEIARYILPIATFTYLYHTVSALTVMRYYRICKLYDAPIEQMIIAEKMKNVLLEIDPDYAVVLQEPLDPADLTEFSVMEKSSPESSIKFKNEFDHALDRKYSLLVDYKHGNEESVAGAVREVLGLARRDMSNRRAIALALDPSKNSIFGEELNLTTHAKLTRALHHASYTFRKKISHTADSQDQRHRMTPASRPILSTHITDYADYITPALIRKSPEAADIYHETMRKTWDAISLLKDMGVPSGIADYLLPNAVSIRFSESTDLLNLRHKHAMRLCYLAQEEIWKASLEEAEQISEINPLIGKYLLPPCGLRFMAGTKPYCPEGKRYCGVPVWKLKKEEWERVI